MKSWDPARSARHLNEEGLNKSFVDLRLFVRGSGIDPKTTRLSFAEALFKEPRKSGFDHITVTG
jgi:hypothetical protein